MERRARFVGFVLAVLVASGVMPSPAAAEPVADNPRPTVGTALVSTSAVLRSVGAYLKVDINPDLPATGYWTFVVQRKVNGVWSKVGTYKSTGTKETASISLKRGYYRIVVPAQHSRKTYTSPQILHWADVTRPTASLTSPAASATVDLGATSGKVSWSGTAYDGLSGVSRVDVLVDGKIVGRAALVKLSTTTVSWSFTSSAITAGAHTLAGRAVDRASNVGSTVSRSVTVKAAGSAWAQVSLGQRSACGVTTVGAVYCWGNNGSGQLGSTVGQSTGSDVPTPTLVTGLGSGVASVSVGSSSACAVTTDGNVLCWGDNSSGQLGDGTVAGSSTPVAVAVPGGTATAVTVGNANACLLTTSGAVYCWGDNALGQLGDGTTNALSKVPVQVVGLTSGATAVTMGLGGGHACAINGSGGVVCWGTDFHGQLGDGTTTTSNVPVAAEGLSSGVVGISAGNSHTCAVTTGGAAYCWGNNASGQLGSTPTGDDTISAASVPTVVAGFTSGMAQVSAGNAETCGVTTAGAVVCWGNNGWGQMGNGTSGNVFVSPSTVSGLSSGGASVSVQSSGACALSATAVASCWGQNFYDRFASDTLPNPVLTPAVVAAP